MKPLFVQWGGGNIGRSFIARVFSHSGFRILFIDVNQSLVNALNQAGAYTIEEVFGSSVAQVVIRDVGAIHPFDQEAINNAIAEASFLGVSVGRAAWANIARPLAEAIAYRHTLHPEKPLDIILAENIHGGREFAKALLLPHLPATLPFDAYVGLAETSIGKMVPIQDSSNLLLLRSEPYNELFVDALAFHHPLPQSKDIHPVTPIAAYVERKLFIHNMGHSATAYLGYSLHPEEVTIAAVLEDERVHQQVAEAMMQSGRVLLALHPGCFTASEVDDHIQDLLRRFSNQALADTVHRVGRDLRRKLRFDDRLFGVITKAESLGMQWDAIGRAFVQALSFAAPDVTGTPYSEDIIFLRSLTELPWVEKIRTATSWDESGMGMEVLETIADKLERLQ